MEQLLERKLLSRKTFFVLQEITNLIKFSLSSDKIRYRSTILIVILGKSCISNCILDNNPWLTVVEECNLTLLFLDFESLLFNFCSWLWRNCSSSWRSSSSSSTLFCMRFAWLPPVPVIVGSGVAVQNLAGGVLVGVFVVLTILSFLAL